MSERAADGDGGRKSWTSFFVAGSARSWQREATSGRPSVVNYAKCLVYTPSTSAAIHYDAAARHMLYDFISIHDPA